MDMSKFGFKLNNKIFFLFFFFPLYLFANDINTFTQKTLNCQQFNVIKYSNNFYKITCPNKSYLLLKENNAIHNLYLYNTTLTQEEIKNLRNLVIYKIKGKETENNKEVKKEVFVIRAPEDAQVSYHFLAFESYKLLLKGYTVNVIFTSQYRENFPLIKKMFCEGKKEIIFDTKDEKKLRHEIYLLFLNLEKKLWAKEEKNKKCNDNFKSYAEKGKKIVEILMEKTTIKRGEAQIQSFGFIVSDKGKIATGAVNGDLVAKYFEL